MSTLDTIRQLIADAKALRDPLNKLAGDLFDLYDKEDASIGEDSQRLLADAAALSDDSLEALFNTIDNLDHILANEKE